MSRKFRFLIFLIILLAVIVGITWYVRQPQELRKEGEQLLDAETGKLVGVARKEYDGTVWRVFSTVNLPNPGNNDAYHGWLTEPASETTYYVGEFFPVQDGFSLTYTTEEDIRFFTHFRVSEEGLGKIPSAPSNSIAIWEFEGIPVQQDATLNPSFTPDFSPSVIPGSDPESSVSVQKEPTPTPEETES